MDKLDILERYYEMVTKVYFSGLNWAILIVL